MIIDAQVHLWAADRPDRPWPVGTSSAGHRMISADQLLGEMELAGVDRAVLVPPSWEGERNDVVLAAARAHPDRFAVMGRVPLDADESVISRWTDEPAMLGIRVTCHRGPQREWLTTATGDWFWAAAERAAVPVMLYAPGLEDDIDRVLQRHPHLRLTLDHVNLGLSVTAASLGESVGRVLTLAAHRSLCVKASGLECHVDVDARRAEIAATVTRLLDAFGSERIFWGTDLTRIPCPYVEALGAFRDGLPGVSDAYRSQLLGEAIRAWLPWR
jgi:predicted TIM-barrel fold metal-dependent hydrolase